MIQILMTMLLLIIAVVDWKTMEIPDGLNGAVAFLAGISLWAMPEVPMPDRIIGAVCVSVPMYLLCILISDAFGGGDIKLVFTMGFFLGWKNVLVGMFLAIMIGGMQALYLLICKKVKAGENAHMAFGPALCVGMIISMFWGERLIAGYFRWFY